MPCRASIGAHRRPMRIRGLSPRPVSLGNICAEITRTGMIIVVPPPTSRSARCKQRFSPSDGGCDFPSDPDKPSDSQPLFWSPRIRPQAVVLSPVRRQDPEPGPTVRLTELSGIALRRADDGWHGIWLTDDVAHQFWLPDAEPHCDRSYAVALTMDVFLELRAHAARRLWRSLNGRSTGPDFRALPAQLRQWHILSLRALDARLSGASYRSIAEALLGFHGGKEDFESDPRKNRARRLVAHGARMAAGDYRRLLHYPVKPGKR
jgi:hypothetical protein